MSGSEKEEFTIESTNCSCYYELIEVLKDPDHNWKIKTIKHSEDTKGEITRFTPEEVYKTDYRFKDWKLSDWYYDNEEARILHRGECSSEECFLNNGIDIRSVILNTFMGGFENILDDEEIPSESILKTYCVYKYRNTDPIYKILFTSGKYFIPYFSLSSIMNATVCSHFKKMNLQNIVREKQGHRVPLELIYTILSEQIISPDYLCPFSEDEECFEECYDIFLHECKHFTSSENPFKSQFQINLECRYLNVKNDIVSICDSIIEHDSTDGTLNNPVYKIHNPTEAAIAIAYISSRCAYDRDTVLKSIDSKTVRVRVKEMITSTGKNCFHLNFCNLINICNKMCMNLFPSFDKLVEMRK